jgi:PAS domain S-box-containing protein
MENLLIIALLIVIAVCFLVIWHMYREKLKQKTILNDSQIEKSEKRFESLVENGLDCVIIISPEGRTTYVSRSVKNILGYSPEEVLNMDIRALIHPHDLAGAEEALIKTIQNPGIPLQGYTSRIKHKNGSWRWIEPVVTNLMHDPSINGIVDNFRDVTDRIKAEADLIKINERFLLATKGSKLGIWDNDLINNILIWDEAMYKIYDVSEGSFDLNSDSWYSRIHEDDLPIMLQQVDKLLKDGTGLDLEFRIVLPDMRIRHIRSFAQIYYDDDGKPARIIGTNLDITNNKDYELTLEQIIFDISHIIRKPVSNILGLSHQIEADDLEKSNLKELAFYMKKSALELDDYTRTLTNAYSKKKLYVKEVSKKDN